MTSSTALSKKVLIHLLPAIYMKTNARSDQSDPEVSQNASDFKFQKKFGEKIAPHDGLRRNIVHNRIVPLIADKT